MKAHFADRAITHALRQILGAETETWIKGNGPERIRLALQTCEREAEQPAQTPEPLRIRTEAWRRTERTILVTHTLATHRSLHTLVNDRAAFQIAWGGPDEAEKRNEETWIDQIQVRQITNEHGDRLRGTDRNRTWTSREAATAQLAKGPRYPCISRSPADGATAKIRLGKAMRVSYAIDITRRADTPMQDTAAQARAEAALRSPRDWNPLQAWWSEVLYIASIEIANRHWTPPPETRFRQHYVVQSARLRGQTREIVVEGTAGGHETMLEDAIERAHSAEEWHDNDWMSDYVESYQHLEATQETPHLPVPSALQMLQRI